MSNEYKDWLSEQTFETLANDNLNIKIQLDQLKRENNKLSKLHGFLHNKHNWSKEDVWIRNYLLSHIFGEEISDNSKTINRADANKIT